MRNGVTGSGSVHVRLKALPLALGRISKVHTVTSFVGFLTGVLIPNTEWV